MPARDGLPGDSHPESELSAMLLRMLTNLRFGHTDS
jgi:hypothetical protein